MDLFNQITKHFWLLCIVVMCVNALVFKIRSRKFIRENPDLEQGYSTLIRGFLVWGNIPWLVMGIGTSIGNIDSIYYYFRPQDGNPYVQAFFGSVFLIWLLGTFWLFFRDGAEMLIKHPGFFRTKLEKPWMIKVYWILCLVGGVIGVVMMYKQDVQVP